MEIKIENDGLRNREGGFLRTYEYSFVTDKLIEVFHLNNAETVSWQSATITNSKKKEKEKSLSEIKGPISDPWVKLEIEAFLIHVNEDYGKVFVHIASDMIELQSIELTPFPEQRNWIFSVEILNCKKDILKDFVNREVIIKAREFLYQTGHIKWYLDDIILTELHPNQKSLKRCFKRDLMDAKQYKSAISIGNL